MSSVSLELSEEVAVITLNDGKANAINAEWLADIDRALDAAEKSRAVVLAGRPGFFSGGLDLKRLPGLPAAELERVLGHFGRVMMRMFAYPKPLVAACTGHAIAGGMVTLLACDERHAADGAFKIGLNESVIGLILPRFVIEMAKAQLDPRVLHQVISAGSLYAPQAARAVGLVDEVWRPEELLEKAVARAKELAEIPSVAYAGNKMGVRGPHLEIGRTAYAEELPRFAAYFGAVATA